MGGGIGKAVISQLSELDIHLVALGTNSYATKKMLDAGAHEGYTGQVHILNYISRASIIIGAMGILIPNSMDGEFTEQIVSAICTSSGVKILIPMNRCNIKVATENHPLSYHINQAVQLTKETISQL